MIIQCPSCKTRFNIDNKTIGVVARPRFQCSHCESYFDGTDQISDSTSNTISKTTFKEDLLLKNPEGSTEIQPKLHISRETVIPSVEKRLLSNFTNNIATWPNSSASNAVLKPPDPETLPEQWSLDAEIEPLNEPIPHEIRSATAGSVSRRMSRHYLPWIILIVLVVLPTFGFWAWSQAFDNTPEEITKILSMTKQNTPQTPPPAGLEIVDIHSEIVTLDDGTQLLQVTGDVFNSSLEDFHGIVIESKLYDTENRSIHSLIVPAHNGLSKAARLHTMKLNTIDTLQHKSAFGAGVLKPNSRQPFNFVLNEFEQAAWYSVRVYSVLIPE